MADMSRSPRPEYALDPGFVSYVGIFILPSARVRRAERRVFALFTPSPLRGVWVLTHLTVYDSSDYEWNGSSRPKFDVDFDALI